MGGRGYLALFSILVCLLLLSSCGKGATGEVIKNTTKPFEAKYPKVTYNDFEEGYFSFKYPSWKEFNDGGDERLLSARQGICTLAVNKYSALPDYLFSFLKSVVADTGNTLLSSDNESYVITYEMPNHGSEVLVQMKIAYCNHQAYSITILCIKDHYVSYHEKIVNTTLESVRCSEEYDLSLPNITNNDLNSSLIRTDAGEIYVLSDLDVVYLVNRNRFITKKLSSFSKVNLLFEQQEFGIEIKMKAELENGKIISLKKNWHVDADVTLYMPVMEALNLFTHIDEVDASNIGIFLGHVQTERASVKKDVLSANLP
jgi:hypothetical protein